MIKAVLFDFFDVIRTDAYKAWLKTNDIPHTGPFFEASHQQDMGETTVEEFLDKLSQLMGRTITVEEIDGTATLDHQVIGILKGVKKNYKTALISNAPSAFLREILEENDLVKYFDKIVISSEVGMVKPSPEAVFIDDNESHTQAAQKLGIKSIQFLSADQLSEELVKIGLEH
jgi:FMN phosphatase YigB (HAD superfamily)